MVTIQIPQQTYQCSYLIILTLVNYLKQQSKMFKNRNKQTKDSNPVDNQLFAFLIRQTTILRDINNALNASNISASQARLHQTIHLIDKKLSFAFSENPEHYHDYIQDFYETQLDALRNQNTQLTTANRLKQRQIQEMQQTLQTFKYKASNTFEGLKDVEQILQLKKQLEHSKLLIEQNGALLNEQNQTIKHLTKTVKVSQKETSKVKKQYESKLFSLDTQINQNKQKFDTYFNAMLEEGRNNQQKFKEFSINSLRSIQNTNNIGRQLEMKYEEVRLLTKKVFESQVLIGKYEREATIKEKTIEELEEQLERYGVVSQQIKYKMNNEKLEAQQKQIQMKGLQERIKLLNATNGELQKRIQDKCSKIVRVEAQLKQLRESNSEKQTMINTLQHTIQKLKRCLQDKQLELERQLVAKNNCQSQIRQLDESIHELQVQNQTIKQNMKKSIITEVQELVDINTHQKSIINNLSKELQATRKVYDKMKLTNQELQNKFDTITSTMDTITCRLKNLEEENKNISMAKTILEDDNLKLNLRNSELQSFAAECEALREQNRKLDKLLNQQTTQDLKETNQKVQEFQKIISSLQNQLKLAKQTISKKDFQHKQYETRIKILQEDLRSISTLYDNEKTKMNKKIKQLEELLKEDLTSRKSNR